MTLSRLLNIERQISELNEIDEILTKGNNKICIGGFVAECVYESNDIEVFTCYNISNAPAPKHSHPISNEFFVMIKGTIQIRIESKEDIEITAGDFFRIDMGVEHSMVPENETVFLIILSPPDRALQYNNQ